MKYVFLPFTWLGDKVSKFFANLFGANPTGVGAVINTICIAVVMSGLQLAVNFASAYIIKNTPGYEQVPAPLLALLFCARPRLGWLGCLLSLAHKAEFLQKVFHYNNHEYLNRAQVTISKVAISSAVSEIIMQCLGAYSLGLTAHVGVNRSFYLIHHLWPYWRGRQARIMYLGALFWLISCVVIILVWTLVVITGAPIVTFFSVTDHWFRNVW